LNVPRAQSLYGIERGRDQAVNQSYPDYLDLRDRNHSFEDLAAYNVALVGLDTGNSPSAAWILEVTGNYFDALSIQPYLGRFFHAYDEHGPNSAPYIVLTRPARPRALLGRESAARRGLARGQRSGLSAACPKSSRGAELLCLRA
jgi:hypothetical protein